MENIKLKLEDVGLQLQRLQFFNLIDASFEEYFLSKKISYQTGFFFTLAFLWLVISAKEKKANKV
jgi:hypothetical protein